MMFIATIPRREQRKNDTPQNCLERHQQRSAANAVHKSDYSLKILVHIHHGGAHRRPSIHPFTGTGKMPPNIGIGQRKNGK